MATSNQAASKPERHRISINLREPTKARLDELRLPGQSYDGFVQQLLSCWKENQKGRGRQQQDIRN